MPACSIRNFVILITYYPTNNYSHVNLRYSPRGIITTKPRDNPTIGLSYRTISRGRGIHSREKEREGILSKELNLSQL